MRYVIKKPIAEGAYDWVEKKSVPAPGVGYYR